MAKKNKKDLARKATIVFVNAVGAILSAKGLDFLNKQTFMSGEEGKLNFKTTGASAGLAIVSCGGAVALENEIASSFLSGLGAGASIKAVENVAPALGLSGLGAVEDYTSLYSQDEPSESISGYEANVQLSGEEVIKIA